MVDKYEIEYNLMRMVELCDKISDFFGALFAGLFLTLTATCCFVAFCDGNALGAITWSGIVLGIIFLCCLFFIMLKHRFINKVKRFQAELREEKERKS